MNDIDLLEHGGGDFAIRRNGLRIALPDPRTEHYQWVLAALALHYVPGTPGDLSVWHTRLVFDRWAAAWDLPDFNSARRLAYLVDHYRSAIAYDLTTHANGADLGDLWRARRWRTLLDLIDHLPPHSWYSASVAEDPEHAKMVADAMAQRKEEDGEERKQGPRLTTWTAEMAMLTNLTDAVRRVEWAVFASQAGQKAGKPPEPLPRPTTALEVALRRAQHADRMRKHQSIVARLLPHKAQSEG